MLIIAVGSTRKSFLHLDSNIPNPKKIDILEDIQMVVAAWNLDVKPETFPTAFTIVKSIRRTLGCLRIERHVRASSWSHKWIREPDSSVSRWESYEHSKPTELPWWRNCDVHADRGVDSRKPEGAGCQDSWSWGRVRHWTAFKNSPWQCHFHARKASTLLALAGVSPYGNSFVSKKHDGRCSQDLNWDVETNHVR